MAKDIAGAVAASMDAATLAEFVKALEQKCTFNTYDGEPYALRFANPEWYVWKLAPGSEAYAVTGDTCTCPSTVRPCKHVQMVKFGSIRTRSNQRGEN